MISHCLKPFGKLLFAIIIFLALAGLNPLLASPTMAAQVLSEVVIQDGGRAKPLDTFARNSLLAIRKASAIKSDGMSAMDWLGQLILQPEISYERRDFKILEPEVLEALGVELRDDHLYSFNELRTGMGKISQSLQTWFQKDEKERNLVENQIVRLYNVLSQYYQISRSLSVFARDFSLADEVLAKEFELKPREKASYLHFHRFADKLLAEVTRLNDIPEASRNLRDRELGRLMAKMSERIPDQSSTPLTILPSAPSIAQETWSSPWTMMGEKQIDAWTWARLGELQNVVDALNLGKLEEAKRGVETFKVAVAHRQNISLEHFYNKADVFTTSLACNILSVILLMCSWMFWPRLWYGLAAVFLSLGWVLIGAGLLMRMVILGRPPVSNLYESIIFVAFVSCSACLILEWIRRNGTGIFCGSVLSAILLFIGLGYAADGDTLGMLVAVLNSNFWLGTHVVTITMGYGIAIVAGLVGHLYLIMAILKPENQESLKEIYKNSIGLSLVALLFTTLGTILGGIWADQSWGRFWGWDPKENGALLIVLWLLMLLHGRISGELKALGFSVGLVLCNIVVALAWFGVNLLNVGLHNYGFTESIETNLKLFCGLELGFALLAYIGAKLRLGATG